MLKKCFYVFTVVFLISNFAFAQTNSASQEKKDVLVEPEKETETLVKGTVKEIAKDGSYIMVDATKIITTKEFIEDAYLDLDDKVEIFAKSTKEGLIAVDYDYILDDDMVVLDEEK